MQRLSSNLTLFFKFFIPIGWATFFGLFLLVIFFVDTSDKPLLASTEFRTIYVSLFLLFLALIYFTLFQLMRVESAEDYLVVTNYFKTLKYPFDSIKKMTVMNFGLFKLVNVHLHAKGTFGQRIPFIAKTINLEEFMLKNPGFFNVK